MHRGVAAAGRPFGEEFPSRGRGRGAAAAGGEVERGGEHRVVGVVEHAEEERARDPSGTCARASTAARTTRGVAVLEVRLDAREGRHSRGARGR